MKITSLFSKNKTHFSLTNSHIFLLFLCKIPLFYTVSLPLITVYSPCSECTKFFLPKNSQTRIRLREVTYNSPTRNGGTFLTSGQSALNSPANGSEVTYSKIQNRLSRPLLDTPMDRFLMQYLKNKCALTLRQCVKKVVLNFQWPIAPP